MPRFLIATFLSLFISNVAVAQHGGTEQEQRDCAKDVQKYCRPVLDQGDLAVLGCLQQFRAKLTASCKMVLTNHGQ
jgi:hypothetical protein